MSKEFREALGLVRDIWQHRWLALAIALLICAVGWPVAYLLPDKYQVEAKVYLDTQSMLKPLLEGLAVDSDVTKQTALLLRRTLLNRPNLEKVARTSDLDIGARDPEDFERVIRKLSQEIRMVGGGKDQLYVISYQNKDPIAAKRVVEAVLNLFVEGALGETRKDTSSTKRFLDEQIGEYQAKLELAESELKEFKRENVGLMPGSAGQTFFTQLSSATNAHSGAKLELAAAANRRNELRRQLAAFTQSASSATSELPGGALDPLQKQLAELRLKYTDQHPDVISLQNRIRQQRNAGGSGSSNLTGTAVRYLDANPIYQDLKVALGTAEAEVASLQVRYAQAAEREKNLRRMIDTMPQVEADLTKLNRDYEIIKDNYEAMVRRREAAKLTYEAEKSDDEVQFRVIESPRVPLLPIGPNRLMLITAVFFIALASGVGLGWLLVQLRQTFHSISGLKGSMGLPVYGAVTVVLGSRQIVKERLQLTAFFFSCAGLCAAYSGLAAVQLLNLL